MEEADTLEEAIECIEGRLDEAERARLAQLLPGELSSLTEAFEKEPMIQALERALDKAETFRRKLEAKKTTLEAKRDELEYTRERAERAEKRLWEAQQKHIEELQSNIAEKLEEIE